MSLLDKWNKNKFSIYKSEEKTTLKLIELIGKWIEELINGIEDLTKALDKKTDLYGDHKGSWQGLNRPTLSEEGMRATVEKLDKEVKIIKNNRLYLSEYGKANDDTFDNSQAFYDCLKELTSRGGGELIIDTGDWYFKKPVVIDFEVFGVTIKGNSRGIQGTEEGQNNQFYGSNLFFKEGDSELFVFNKKCNQFTLQDFTVELSDYNAFITFNYTFHQGRILNVRTNGGTKGITLNTGTYVEIDRFSFSTYSPVAQYGISIGEEDTGYTTEFIYIKKSSLNFGWVSEGTGIKILRCQGGLWLENLDICNTKGIAIKMDNMIGSSIAYFNFDNNNFSGVGIGYYFKATNNIGGVYINNQRISLFSDDVDERYIYCEKDTPGLTDLHVRNLYIRTRKGTIVPTYLMEIRRTNPESEIDLTGGEPIDAPILLEGGIKKYNDFRIETLCIDKSKLQNGTNNLFMSNKKCLINKLSNTYFMPYVSGVYQLPCSQINFNEEGKPNAVITISDVEQIPSGRIFIDFSGKNATLNNLPE